MDEWMSWLTPPGLDGSACASCLDGWMSWLMPPGLDGSACASCLDGWTSLLLLSELNLFIILLLFGMINVE
jgi:hypothetical protein